MLDITIRLLSQDPAMDERMGTLLGVFPRTGRSARLRHTFQVTHRRGEGLRAFNDCSPLTSTGEVDRIPSLVVAGINRVAIEGLTDFAVHAGVIQHGERLVVFPAKSGEGKTTLTAACLLTGFGYVSDEALVLDETGKVVPYPKPLALSPWTRGALGMTTDATNETLLTGAELGSTIGSGGTAVSDIVLASYGAPTETLIELPPSNGVAALISHSFNHFKDPERAFRLATSTADSARVWRLEYDHPMRAAELLWEELA